MEPAQPKLTHSMSRIIQIERHTYIQLVEQHMLKLAKALNLRPPTPATQYKRDNATNDSFIGYLLF